MILSTDNYQRIYEQIKDERVKTRYYLQKDNKKMVQSLKAARSVPVCRCETLTIPATNNTYLLYGYAMTWHEVRNLSYWNGAPLLMNDENGHRVAVMLRSMIEKDTATNATRSYDTLQVYSGHFFSRYRERMGLSDKLTTEEVIATFFGRNEGYFAELEYDKIVLEKNRHKGNSAFGIDDGVTLAEVTRLDSGVVVFKHNTFLSRSEMKGNQEEATPSKESMRAFAMREDVTSMLNGLNTK